jgi:hypothetical protein
MCTMRCGVFEGMGDDVGEHLTANARVSNTGEKYDEST